MLWWGRDLLHVFLNGCLWGIFCVPGSEPTSSLGLLSGTVSFCRGPGCFLAPLGPPEGDRASGSTSGALPVTSEPWEMWPGGAVFVFALELALQVLFVELLAFFYDPHSHIELCDMHFYFNFISGAILCSYPCFSIFSFICFRFMLCFMYCCKPL